MAIRPEDVEFFQMMEDYEPAPRRKPKKSRRERLARETNRILKHLKNRELSEVPYFSLFEASISGIRTIEDLDKAGALNAAQEADTNFVINIETAIFGQKSLRSGDDLDREAGILDAEFAQRILIDDGFGREGEPATPPVGNPEKESES